MAKFVKKDGKEVHLVRRPERGHGLVGVIDGMECTYNESMCEHHLLITLTVSETEAVRYGGLSPVIFQGAKVDIRLIHDNDGDLNPDDDEASDDDGIAKEPEPEPESEPESKPSPPVIPPGFGFDEVEKMAKMAEREPPWWPKDEPASVTATRKAEDAAWELERERRAVETATREAEARAKREAETGYRCKYCKCVLFGVNHPIKDGVGVTRFVDRLGSLICGPASERLPAGIINHEPIRIIPSSYRNLQSPRK